MGRVGESPRPRARQRGARRRRRPLPPGGDPKSLADAEFALTLTSSAMDKPVAVFDELGVWRLLARPDANDLQQLVDHWIRPAHRLRPGAPQRAAEDSRCLPERVRRPRGDSRQALRAPQLAALPAGAHRRAHGLGPERPRATIPPRPRLPGLAGPPGPRRARPRPSARADDTNGNGVAKGSRAPRSPGPGRSTAPSPPRTPSPSRGDPVSPERRRARGERRAEHRHEFFGCAGYESVVVGE